MPADPDVRTLAWRAGALHEDDRPVPPADLDGWDPAAWTDAGAGSDDAEVVFVRGGEANPWRQSQGLDPLTEWEIDDLRRRLGLSPAD